MQRDFVEITRAEKVDQAALSNQIAAADLAIKQAEEQRRQEDRKSEKIKELEKQTRLIRDQYQAAKVFNRKATVIIDAAEKIKAIIDKHASATGFTGSLTSGIPRAPANQVKNLLQVIGANIGLDTIISLKRRGGSLGSLSEKELEALQQTMGTLSPEMPVPELVYTLDHVMRTYAEEAQFNNAEAEVLLEQGVNGVPIEPVAGVFEYVDDSTSLEAFEKLPIGTWFRTPENELRQKGK